MEITILIILGVVGYFVWQGYKNKPTTAPTNTIGGNTAMPKESRANIAIGLCPFSWIEVSKPAGCFSSLFGSGNSKQVTEPQPCMMSRCQLWDSSAGNCGLLKK